MLVFCLWQGVAWSQTSHRNKTQKKFEKIYAYALRGEMSNVFEILQSVDDEKLTPKQRVRKKVFYDRFIYKAEKFDYRTTNSEMIGLYKRFQNYWHSVLIEKVDQKIADSLFRNEMAYYLQREYKPKMEIKEIRKKMYGLFQKYLRSKGYYGLVMGKTGILFDLYLWQNEKEVVYDVQLPEAKIKVPVVFMQNFISYGWSHYATLGRSSSGGWVGAQKIFCVEEAYDIKSENFTVSYVTHESQHFVDRKMFPKLVQADLEYRAKLTELSYANKSLYKVIDHFIKYAKNDKKYAHAYANYFIIKELSKVFFNKDFESDLEKWKKVPVKKINKISKKILKANTKMLKSKGAKTVTSGIL